MEENHQVKRDEIPRRDWAGIIEAQSKSGQKAGVYCREHGIPYKLFLYHRRKFLGRGAGLRSERRSRRSVSAFVPVRLTSDARTILRISSGIVLECDQFPEVKWLIELAREFALRDKRHVKTRGV